MSHIVTAPLVIAKKEDGSDLYLYEGAQVPEHVSADEIKRLEELGMIDKIDGRSAKSKSAPTSESN